MDKKEALELLRGGEEGIREWNDHRKETGGKMPDLSRADLRGALLSKVNLSFANLSRADLSGADLRGANLSGARLTNTRLDAAKLGGAAFGSASCGWTSWINVDLSSAKGLKTMFHKGPSTICADMLYDRQGQVPEEFLRGCGVPDSLVDYLPSLVGAQEPIQFYSCFISYSHKDEEFAKRLYSQMRDEKLRVWFAPEDIKGGKKLHEQIDQAIRQHDKLLLVLSEASMASEWVETEIYRARQREIKEKRRMLFPIRLVPFERIEEWECFDSDTGKDLAREIRDYFIPDFSNWMDHDGFEEGFGRLLDDLTAEE